MGTIGIDFGGTWIRGAFVDSSGNPGEMFRVKTHSERNAGSILADLTNLVEKTRASSNDSVDAIGIALPTTVDDNGRMAPCPNLPTMPDFPVVRELEQRFEEPVWIENDARCFVMGEWRYGKGMGCDTVAGITLGTSVGLGVIAHGSLLIGKHRQAGEIWRSPALLENSGDRDHAEFITVHDLLKAQALEDIYASCCGRNKTAQKIAADAREDDDASAEAFHTYGSMLGKALCWIANILDPEIIVLGGSAAKDFHLFIPAAKKALNRPDILLEQSELGDLAAVLGAAEGAAAMGETV